MNLSSVVRTWPVVLLLSFVGGAQGVTVQFAQLNWLSDGGAVLHPNSRVGSAELFFTPSDVMFTPQGAYVNIVTQLNVPGALPQWSVQNWFIRFPNQSIMLRSTPAVQFNLGNPPGQPVPLIQFIMTVTPQPLNVMPSGPPLPGPMQHLNYHVGGRTPLDGGATGGSGLSTIPLTISAFICIPPFFIDPPVSFGGTTVGGDGLRAVDEDVNGCAPGSAARSLDYMVGAMGTPFGSCQDAYDELVGDMSTVTGRGGGTADGDMLDGKNEYVADHMLPINSDLQYGLAAQIARVKSALNDGGDVEILIGWAGGGGHAAMITSVINLASGKAIITYVDDPTQGDGMAENEEHTIVVNPNGSFPGGNVDGFLVETVKPSRADLNADGHVNGLDLAMLLAAWGPCTDPPCGADLNGDGVINGFDLGILLGMWAP